MAYSNKPTFKYSALAVLTSTLLLGCGDKNSEKTQVNTVKETQTAQITKNEFNIDLNNVKHWLGTNITLNDSKNIKETDINVFQNEAAILPIEGRYYTENGFFTLQSSSEIVYVATDDDPETFQITLKTTSNEDINTINIISINTDPLVKEQWHLNNTGQLGYARQPDLAEHWRTVQTVGLHRDEREVEEELTQRLQQSVSIAGEDMNVMSAYAQGITGEGEVVVVVDSGLEIRHEDLVDNILPNRSLNFNVSSLTPTDPTSRAVGGDHGTSVAGLIAASGWNGLGGRGVAPDSKLIGINFIGRGIPQTESNNMLGHGLQGSGILTHERIAAFNRSYGRDLVQFSSYDKIDEAMSLYPAKYLRDGQGTLNVKSSGNSFITSFTAGNFCEHSGAQEFQLTCANTLFESDLNYPHYIAVAALNADGTRSSYSSAGPNMFISAPAGERGDWEPAMITTDQMTCLRGYAGNPRADFLDANVFRVPGMAQKIYPFNAGAFDENASCHYTNGFNGTSSAAPNTSGVVALILSANKSLHWRDVKHIMLHSADKNHSQDPMISIPVGNGTFDAHLGWVTNGVGIPFNNNYGFGRANAGKAVEMALNYSTPLPEQRTTKWFSHSHDVTSHKIPDNNANGLEVLLTIEDDITIEAVQFDLAVFNNELVQMGSTMDNIQSTAGTDLAIEVISPAGTRNVLLSSKQALLLPQDISNQPATPGSAHGYIINGALMSSNAFYGENAKGKWRIRFIDTSDKDIAQRSAIHNGYKNNSEPSELRKAAIRVIGH